MLLFSSSFSLLHTHTHTHTHTHFSPNLLLTSQSHPPPPRCLTWKPRQHLWSLFSTPIWYLIYWTVRAKSLQPCSALCDPVGCSPPSKAFSRQKYCSGLPFLTPRDLPDPGIKLIFLMFPVLAGGSFTTSATWEAQSISPTNCIYKTCSILIPSPTATSTS